MSSEWMSSSCPMRGLEFEPEEGIRGERKDVWSFSDCWERYVTEHLDGLRPFVVSQVERDWLGEAAEIGRAENRLVGAVGTHKFAEIDKDLAVCRVKKCHGSTSEDMEKLAQSDHIAGPVEQA